MILGWDQLHRYGWSFLDDGVKALLTWGDRRHEIISTSHPSVASIDDALYSPLFRRHARVFGEPGKLPAANLPELKIVTEGRVVSQRPYRTALTKRAVIDEEIDKMLALGVIRPSCSEWASPVTLVPKKDGSTRFCIDYWQLNEVTVKDRYPIPLVADIFDQLAGSTLFSLMDLRSGYWQLPVHEDSIKKTAFVCHRGQFEWLRMPFGLTNAPSIYQRAMNQVLAPLIGKCVMVFIDDIVVYSQDPADHESHLDQVLQLLGDAGLTVKGEKCSFGRKQIDLLGYVVSADGITAQPQKTAAIRDLPAPTDIGEVRSFLGMAGYYRQLVPEYATLAEPLHRLTRKDVEWTWGGPEQAAFQALKDSLTSTTVMAHPRVNDPYILYTDACDYALGGVLCQEDEDGVERPIQYISASFNSTQRRWAVIEKEAYGVIYCMKKLRAYLLGSEFTVFTDHKPLLSLFTKEMANTKIQRWAVLLAEYNARIKYRPGPNRYAESHSHLPRNSCARCL
jgi:hypothetical protein